MTLLLRPSSVMLLATLAAGTALPARLLAQQDTGMMQHDSAMPGHAPMMEHDSGMGANMMFMGASNLKAGGDYEITAPRENSSSS